MKKILVLDDSEDILDMVGEVLSYENFEVISLSEGSGFIETALSVLPDLILLDYRLSDENGGELCKQIKSHPSLQHIPVIIFSAYLFQTADLEKLKCDAVIAKPFDIQSLVDTINSLTRSNFV